MKRYKIVVLLNLKAPAQVILKSAISLAKMINGDIEVFSVKKPNEIVDRDSHLSAIRTINKQRTLTKKKMQNLIAPLSKEYGIDIKHSFAFGNVKNEIEDFINKEQPNIVVLGKRKTKVFNLIGDNITGFVLDIYKGALMIADGQKALEPHKEISLGVLNSISTSLGLEFAENLVEHIQTPVKSFKIAEHSTLIDKAPKTSNKKTIEYVFDGGDNAIKGISNYVTKSNINLLYVERIKKNSNKKPNLMKSSIKDIVNHINVNLILTGEQSYS